MGLTNLGFQRANLVINYKHYRVKEKLTFMSGYLRRPS
jgi:hypothetical protein